MMAGILAGRGGLRKTSGPAGSGATAAPASSAASPARTFSPPSAAAKPAAAAATSPTASTTQPAAAARFGAPKPAAAASNSTPAAATSPVAAAKPAVAAKPAAAKPAAAKPAAAPVPDKKDEQGWQELMTPEGVPYYHNKLTNGQLRSCSRATTQVSAQHAHAVFCASDSLQRRPGTSLTL